MSAHDMSAIPTDATAVSAITRAQNDSRRWGGTGDIFSKAHLDFFAKRAMADDATTEHCAYNDPPCPPSQLFLEKNWSSSRKAQRPFSSCAARRGTILAPSDDQVTNICQSSDNSDFVTQIYW